MIQALGKPHERACDLGAGMSGWNGEERTPPMRETAKYLWSAFLRGLGRNCILSLIHVYTLQQTTFLRVHGAVFFNV